MRKIFNRNSILLILLLSIVIAGMILPYIITNTPFEYGGDLKPSGFSFYVELKNLFNVRKLLSGVFPFYSWNLFLGTNFWASKSFYVVGDIYNYLTMWIPTHFYNVVELLTVIRLLISGVLFYCLLGFFSENKIANIIGALSYAFSAWIIFFLGQMSFVSFYSLVPLYFIAIELYLRKGKHILFIISVAILLFTNYYFFFSLSMFTPLYYSYRYYNHFGGFQNFIKKTLILIGYYLVGVLITGIITIPTLYYMLGNDRVGNMSFSAFYDYIKINVHLVTGMFVPSQVYIYRNNVFETGGHTTREITLWAGSLTGLLLPQFLSDEDKRFKFSTSIFYAVMLIILFTPIGGSIMHGFSESSFRWTLLFIISNLIVANRYLSNPQRIHRKNLLISLAIIVSIVLFSIPLTLIGIDALSVLFKDYWVQMTLFGGVAFVFILFAWIVLSSNTQRMMILLALTVIELFAYSSFIIGYSRRLPLGSWEFINAATTVLQSEPNELNQYLNDLQPDNAYQYFRTYVPHDSLYWDYSHNQSIHYQLKGLMTYDSTYAPSFNDLKQIAPQVKDYDSDWIFNIKDPDLVDFLNVKYAIVVNEDELPHDDFKLITDSYRGSLQIYENMNYRALGTTYSSILSYEKIAQQMKPDLEILENQVLAHDKDISKILPYLKSKTKVDLMHIEYFDNQLSGVVHTDDLSFMVMTLPYDKGWKVLINGENVEVFKVNGGFMGVPLQNGENRLEMYFMPQGFKLGFMMSALGTLILIIMMIKQAVKGKQA